ncbi:MAG: glycosyltransferase family 4 protein [Candidatus Baldrarchaeia archaeon]
MRIVFVLPNFLPVRIGGTEVVTYYLARELSRRGNDVYVLTSHFRGLPYAEVMEGVKVRRVPWTFNYWFETEIRFLGYHEFVLRSLNVADAIDPDIIHAQGFFAGIFAYVARKVRGFRYCVGVQGSDINVRFPFKGLALKFIYKSADAIFVLTNEMKNKVERIIREGNIHVIPSGIDRNLFDGTKYSVKRRGEERVVIFVGGLRRVKGVDNLIKAFYHVRKIHKDVKLVIVGDGPLRNYLVDLVRRLGLERHVIFEGARDHVEIPDYMAKADIFVLPSLSEGLPNVLLEAMAMGLPIVATHVGGVPEVVIDGVNGFLVSPGDIKGLAEKICLLLEDDDLRERIRRRNLATSKLYSWEEIARRVEEVYRQICGS